MLNESPLTVLVVLVTKRTGYKVVYVNVLPTTEWYHSQRCLPLPYPQIDDTLSMLCDKQWFTTVALISGYLQVL